MSDFSQGLLSIDDLSLDHVFELFKLSQKPKKLKKKKTATEPPCGALCFFEPSSRTKLSFERAGQVLGVQWLDFQPETSSLVKGESARESLRLLQFYGAEFLVVRHSQTGFAHWAREWTGLPVFNAGDGAHEHPTQALGDAFCLFQKFPQKKLKIAFFGNVSRSRVARSVTKLFKLLGHEILVTDDGQESTEHFCEAFGLDKISKADLSKMNIVYTLRTQKERGGKITLGPLMPGDLGSKTLVMDAGPVIEGETMSLELCDFTDPRMLIHQQVKACLDIRRSLLQKFLEDRR